MDLQTLLFTLLGIAIGVASLVLGWRFRPKQPSLVASVRITPIGLNKSVDDMQITWKDRPVTEPTLVEFSCRNVGPGDIPTRAFEGGQLSVGFQGAQVLHLLPSTSPRVGQITSVDGGFEISFPSYLLKQDEGCRATVLCDGRPVETKRTLRLAGVDTTTSLKKLRRRRDQRQTALVSIPGFTILFILASLNVLNSGRSPMELIPLGFVFLVSGAMTQIFFGLSGSPGPLEDKTDFGETGRAVHDLPEAL